MTLEKYRETYYDLSAKASDIARQLSFAGIALIWVFRDGAPDPTSLPRVLLLPTTLLIAALACDLLQYIIGTAVWGAFARHQEKNGKKPDSALLAPGYFNWPALFFFWSKLVNVLAAYFLILRFAMDSMVSK
jgi:hypothetical protein